MSTLSPFKILFVDNSRTTRAVMSSLFEQHGYAVEAVNTGPEAINKIKDEPFDIIIMDLYMPVMNGYEAAKIIRSGLETYKDIPIIALSASQDPKDIELCKSVGMNEYVVKTENNAELFNILDRYRNNKKSS